jgi:hypothetical protein
MLAKPNTVSTLRTSLGVMKSMMADKAMTCCKEQVSVVIRQSGESIKSNTIDFHNDWSGAMQLMEELNPVRVIVIGHGILNYFHAPQSSFIPPTQSQKNH